MNFWYFMYDILGICLIVTVSIILYKIFILSNSDKYGIPRNT